MSRPIFTPPLDVECLRMAWNIEGACNDPPLNFDSYFSFFQTPKQATKDINKERYICTHNIMSSCTCRGEGKSLSAGGQTRKKKKNHAAVLAILAAAVGTALVFGDAPSGTGSSRALRALSLASQEASAEPWWWKSVSQEEMESNPHGIWKVRFPTEDTTADLGAGAASRTSTSAGRNEQWELADYIFLASIQDATVANTKGLVCNATQAYTFGKWYWEQGATDCVSAVTEKIKAEATAVAAGAAPPATTTNGSGQSIGGASNRNTAGYVSLLAIFDNYFQHIPFDTLPKMIMVCPFLHRNSDIDVLVMNDLQRDVVLEICPAIDTDRFRVAGSDAAPLPLQASTIYIPHFARDDGSVLKMGLTCQKCLPSLGPEGVENRGTDALYIPRGGVRSVANEDDVVQAISEIFPTLQVYHPTNNWRADRHVLSKARVIITPHGGALANMIFAPTNYTKIVEFLPLSKIKAAGGNERPCYFGLAQALGFDYYEVEPKAFDFEAGKMDIPIDGLREVVRKVRDQIALEEDALAEGSAAVLTSVSGR